MSYSELSFSQAKLYHSPSNAQRLFASIAHPDQLHCTLPWYNANLPILLIQSQTLTWNAKHQLSIIRIVINLSSSECWPAHRVQVMWFNVMYLWMMELLFRRKARFLTSCRIHRVIRSSISFRTFGAYLLCRAWNLVHGLAWNIAIHHGEWTEVWL